MLNFAEVGGAAVPSAPAVPGPLGQEVKGSLVYNVVNSSQLVSIKHTEKEFTGIMSFFKLTVF